MRQTLLNILECNRLCREAGREPRPDELARIIMDRIPPSREQQVIYFGDMGAWISATLDGVMPDP